MNALLVHLKLESPLLLTGVASGEENSSRSLEYIPGSALRGALAARLTASAGDLTQNATARQVIFGDVHYLNGYLSLNGTRCLPTPESWRKLKADEEKAGLEIKDFALLIDPGKDARVSRPFIWRKNGSTAVTYPGRQVRLHIGSEARGVVKKGQSTVYQYDALKAGQSFICPILSENPQDLDEVRKLLKADDLLWLGRSRSAGYGKVVVEKIEPQSGMFSSWQEAAPAATKAVDVLLFTSDALLRDDRGQPTHDLDAALSAQFNRPIHHQSAFLRPAVVGGYNRKWGLPLPQHAAVGMGSVFTYDKGVLTQAELDMLAAEGIGERRSEGFGRLVLNWPGSGKIVLDALPNPGSSTLQQLSPASKKLAAQIATSLLRSELDDQLQTQANRLKISGDINNHQLSRLRQAALKGLDMLYQRRWLVQTAQPGEIPAPVNPCEPLLTFTSPDYLKEKARKQFEKARVEQEAVSLLDWVKLRAESADVLTEYLEFNDQNLPAVAGEKAEIQVDLAQEYTLRLVEAVVHNKLEQNRQTPQNRKESEA